MEKEVCYFNFNVNTMYTHQDIQICHDSGTFYTNWP